MNSSFLRASFVNFSDLSSAGGSSSATEKFWNKHFEELVLGVSEEQLCWRFGFRLKWEKFKTFGSSWHSKEPQQRGKQQHFITQHLVTFAHIIGGKMDYWKNNTIQNDNRKECSVWIDGFHCKFLPEHP